MVEWLEGWSYRKSKDIVGANNAATNYSIKLILHNGSGTDNNTDIFLNDHCTDFLNDIAFTDSDGVTQWDFWIESNNDTDAVVWIEVRDDLGNSTQGNNSSLYIYYGNASATYPFGNDQDKMDNTFLFADHFYGDSLNTTNKWTVVQGDVGVSDGILILTGTSSTRGLIKSKTNFSIDSALHCLAKGTTDAYMKDMHWCSANNDGDWNNRVDLFSTADSFLFQTKKDGTNTTVDFQKSNFTTYQIYSWQWQSGKAQLFINGVSKKTITTNIPTVNLNVLFYEGSVDGKIIYVDWIFVRKFVSPEPHYGDSGEEETSGGQTISHTFSNDSLGGYDIRGILLLSQFKSDIIGGLETKIQTINHFLSDIIENLDSAINNAYHGAKQVFKTFIDYLGELDNKAIRSLSRVKNDIVGNLENKASRGLGRIKTDIIGSTVKSEWLDGWFFRKTHTINNATNAGANYQIKIVVHYGSGTDNDKDVYCNGKCKTDFSDIRFTSGDGINLLDYWIENKTDSDNAVFWVEVADDLSTKPSIIYVYYSNNNVSTTSNITTTFIDSNDFENDVVDQVPASWTEEYPTIYQIRVKDTSWYIQQGNKGVSIKSIAGGGGFFVYRDITSINQDNSRAIDFWIKTSANASSQQIRIKDGTTDKFILDIFYSPLKLRYHNGSGWVDIMNISDNTWYHITIYNIDFTNRQFDLDVDNVNKVTNGIMYADTTQLTRFSFRSVGVSAPEYAFDTFFIRKRISSEPTHGDWGIDEYMWFRLKSIVKTISDSIGQIDIKGIKNIAKFLSDKIGSVESKIKHSNKFLSDILGNLENKTSRGLERVKTDIIGNLDTKSIINIAKFLSDKIGNVESKVKSIIKAFSDKIGGVDTLQFVQYFEHVFTEVLGMVDSKIKIKKYIRTFLEKTGLKHKYNDLKNFFKFWHKERPKQRISRD